MRERDAAKPDKALALGVLLETSVCAPEGAFTQPAVERLEVRYSRYARVCGYDTTNQNGARLAVVLVVLVLHRRLLFLSG